MSTQSRFPGGNNKDNTSRILTNEYQNPLYAATIALILVASKTLVQVKQLTGALTMSANVDTGNDDIPPFVGDEVTMLFASDGTNRVVTFGTGFLPTGTLTVTAGKTASAKFIFNGTVWQETGSAVTA